MKNYDIYEFLKAYKKKSKIFMYKEKERRGT